MAATAPLLASVEPRRLPGARQPAYTGIVAVSALTILAIAVHGYHPYAEDGGLYLAGVKRVLHPDLYPSWGGFTTAHLRFSLFAPVVASLVRASRLNLMTVMLLLYVSSIWATLLAAWLIAVRCYKRTAECLAAVTLVALLLTVPVAGTSLMLMDPYVSARSISTPCSMLALAAVLDISRRLRQQEPISFAAAAVCLVCLLIAALVHPLMAAYALGCVIVIATGSLSGTRLQWSAYTGLCIFVMGVGVFLIRFTPAPPPGYMEVARTRTYWFLSYWHWYELVGLIAPLMVLTDARLRRSDVARPAAASLAQAGLVVGTMSVLVALVFARPDVASHAVARLQPLRVFQTIYVITILSVGATLGRLVLKRHAWRWAAMIAGLGAVMLSVQVQVFPHSAHLEFPWQALTNGWEQAFVWIRDNTPRNAVFALDADYISSPGEDSHNFRAIAERSTMPDYSKDGGIASIAPDLTADWVNGEVAQKGLDRATDKQRISALQSWPVHWIVLSSTASTEFECDYMNSAAKVCRVPSATKAHVTSTE